MAKTWIPIATQRNRRPQNFASIQGKPTLTAFTGKITIINPVVTSKGKFTKALDSRFVQGTLKGKYPKNIKFSTSCNTDMSPVHLINLSLQRNQQEDREGLSRTRMRGRGNLGHSGGWQDIEGNHTHSAIHI
ncbi:hypothetical protein O181_097976 [Austropuccinia psidii MF-1]|uniref:Uncharacterized protein n=1 Tax=Austropuccinia psidii MF-1 TaxID=1389203 RepID=A0A9Q3PFJ7_9BASI|nr:hypothetical protein [Austropuccinia psidii MF-1]